jgi:hypothetical protein
LDLDVHVDVDVDVDVDLHPHHYHENMLSLGGLRQEELTGGVRSTSG